jgi:catechol 2,3-dioxygenase-like lactoylglutathione lyase family enzyme
LDGIPRRALTDRRERDHGTAPLSRAVPAQRGREGWSLGGNPCVFAAIHGVSHQLLEPTLKERNMIDHIILTVNDVERSLAFYEASLAPLNIKFFLPYRGENGHPDYKAAIAAGAKDNISPRSRLEYYPGYYAARMSSTRMGIRSRLFIRASDTVSFTGYTHTVTFRGFAIDDQVAAVALRTRYLSHKGDEKRQSQYVDRTSGFSSARSGVSNVNRNP